MLGKLFASIFALVFGCAGLTFTYFFVFEEVYDSWRMQSWVEVNATLDSARLRSSRGDDTTTYGVDVTYHFSFNDKIYHGDRPALATENDNIGSFQEDLGRKLERQLANNTPITVYVNPSNPNESIINRELRWGLLLMKSVFSFIFMVVGFGVLFAIWSKSKSKKTANDVRPAKQASTGIWQDHKKWSKPTQYSNARQKMFVGWGVCLFWNGLTSPGLIAIPEELGKGNYGILVILIFLLVGLFIFAYALKETWLYIKIGRSPLTLDPHPGTLGGDVGGVIEFNMAYNPRYQAIVTLSHCRSYMSGSGKERTRRESLIWQSEQYAIMEPTAKGSRAKFLFSTPADCSESELHDTDYKLWRITIEIDIPGPDIKRQYEIPVFNTNNKSQYLSHSAFSDRGLVNSEHAEAFLAPTLVGASKVLSFPKQRAVLWQLPFLLTGITTLLVMFDFILPEIDLGSIGTFIISFIAILMTWIAGYYLGRKLIITIEPNGDIERCTYQYGFRTSRKKIKHADINKIYQKETSSSQTGTKHTTHHAIYLESKHHRKLSIAYGIDGKTLADHVVDSYRSLLNLD